MAKIFLETFPVRVGEFAILNLERKKKRFPRGRAERRAFAFWGLGRFNCPNGNATRAVRWHSQVRLALRARLWLKGQ
jgi:hypothetical protein